MLAKCLLSASGQRTGIWQRIHNRLHSELRHQANRHKHPTAGCLDSQAVKTASVPGIRSYDAGKKVTGRKRHLSVDMLCLLLVVVERVLPMFPKVPEPDWFSDKCAAAAKNYGASGSMAVILERFSIGCKSDSV